MQPHRKTALNNTLNYNYATTNNCNPVEYDKQPVSLLPVIYVPQGFINSFEKPPDESKDPDRPLSDYESNMYHKLLEKMYGYTVRKASSQDVSQMQNEEVSYLASEPHINHVKTQRIFLEASSLPQFECVKETQADILCNSVSTAVSTTGLAVPVKTTWTQSAYDRTIACQTSSYPFISESISRLKFTQASPYVVTEEVLMNNHCLVQDEINESKFTQTDCLNFCCNKSSQTGGGHKAASKSPCDNTQNCPVPKKKAVEVSGSKTETSCKKKEIRNATAENEILAIIDPKMPKKRKRSGDRPLQQALANNLVVSTKANKSRLRLRNSRKFK